MAHRRRAGDTGSGRTRTSSVEGKAHEQPAGTVAAARRLGSLDILRGVALLGILLMNIVAMGLPHWAYDDPDNRTAARPAADYWVWVVNTPCCSKARSADALLDAVRRRHHPASRLARKKAGGDAPADIHLRRNMWLVLFGMIHGYLLLWPGDILYMYGLAGLFLFVFRRVTSAKPPDLSALLILALQVPKMYGMSRGLSEAREGLRAARDADRRRRPTLERGAKKSRRAGRSRWARRVQSPTRCRRRSTTERAGYGRNVATLGPNRVHARNQDDSTQSGSGTSPA